MPQQDAPNEPNWGKLATVGLDVAVGVGLGLLIGMWIDRKWNTAPWAILIGAVLGFAAGLYLMIKELMRANRS